MIISPKYGFTFLCTPKCASTSIEEVILPYGQLSTDASPIFKHTNFRRYERFISPYIFATTKKNLEVICVMREPMEWLKSWYRYRQRDVLKGKSKSTHGQTFASFARDYMNGKLDIGSQYNFVRDQNGNIGVDKIFDYGNLKELENYFHDKTGYPINFGLTNKSKVIDIEIEPDLLLELKEFNKKDYEIYNNINSKNKKN